MDWNSLSEWIGTGGRLQSESLVGFDRIMHWTTTPEAALAKWDLVEKFDGLFTGAFIALPVCLFKDAVGIDKGKFKFPLKLWNQSVTKLGRLEGAVSLGKSKETILASFDANSFGSESAVPVNFLNESGKESWYINSESNGRVLKICN